MFVLGVFPVTGCSWFLSNFAPQQSYRPLSPANATVEKSVSEPFFDTSFEVPDGIPANHVFAAAMPFYDYFRCVDTTARDRDNTRTSVISVARSAIKRCDSTREKTINALAYDGMAISRKDLAMLLDRSVLHLTLRQLLAKRLKGG